MWTKIGIKPINKTKTNYKFSIFSLFPVLLLSLLLGSFLSIRIERQALQHTKCTWWKTCSHQVVLCVVAATVIVVYFQFFLPPSIMYFFALLFFGEFTKITFKWLVFVFDVSDGIWNISTHFIFAIIPIRRATERKKARCRRKKQ